MVAVERLEHGVVGGQRRPVERHRGRLVGATVELDAQRDEVVPLARIEAHVARHDVLVQLVLLHRVVVQVAGKVLLVSSF